MQDPQIPLQTAVYTALATPPLVVEGETVPVFTQAASGMRYVLLSQWTAVPLALRAACQQWECTCLVDIVDSYPVSGQVNELLALTIGSEIISRLMGKRLSLSGGWQMDPILISQASTLADDRSKETVDVHRYIRLRFTLTK